MSRDRLLARLGAGLAGGWGGSAAAGGLPGTWAVVAQAWWWVASSCVVLSVALCWPPRLTLRAAGLGLGLLLLGVVGWIPRMPGIVTWVCQPLLWLLAGIALVERWGWTPLRQAVCWWAWAQVVLWPLSWVGWTLYDEGWTGTLGRRAVVGCWLGLASLWSSSWRAWVLAALSLLTGSVSGLVALLRLVPLRWRHPLTWVALGGVVALSGRWWGIRLTERWEVWTQAVALIPTHWLTGWGLQQLPVGFREALLTETAGTRYSPILDLHNTWLDVAVRGGLMGLSCLGLVMGWAFRRSQETKTLWTWGFAAWVMTWQSVAAQPALLCLGIVWLMSLCEPRRVDVAEIPSVGR